MKGVEMETYLRSRKIDSRTIEKLAFTEKEAPQEKDRPEGVKLVEAGGHVLAIWQNGAWVK